MQNLQRALEAEWMAPHELRRPYKRPAISDQQRRRDIELLRQSQQRSDSQNRARRLASSILSLPDHASPDTAHIDLPDVLDDDYDLVLEQSPELRDASPTARDLDVVQASKLKGSAARHWFARQLMLPEWMIDVPPNLDRDWPAGKRCFVVSSNGSTVSRLRNGSVLHHFPSFLPNGARNKDISAPSHVYCILDCIYHEFDQTYYVIDMVCWRGYSLYNCSAEFRFFWLNSKLSESGACNPPSTYHRYRFSVVPICDCNQIGLHKAYTGSFTFVKDGLLFYNRHAHYQTGNTPLALVWKDDLCSQYVLDTDSKGHVPAQQQVVLELQEDGNLMTSDDHPIVLGFLERDFLQKSGLQAGNLLRFSVIDECVKIVDGKLELGDLQYIGKANRARAFADSYSKVFFQYTARHSPLRFHDLIAFLNPNYHENAENNDIEMIG
ncbi:snurportin-1 isoform X2 [Phalaenopsis equestris]|uniref:snurportin-1 isoform X2 n=1 Tax=Phalaenopsis equestris TaxID=78828 RepID=UPI0009E323DD|nr:snurportin-1 isoform X2 [Phalaenopsis equestris]